MKKEKILLWKAEEYTYRLSFGFVPNMMSHLHEDDVYRPCIVVVPGGGYCSVSPSEAEIVALKFYEKGYHTFVVTYTTNFLLDEPLKMQPLQDLSRAVRLIRLCAQKYKIDTNRIILYGGSAGGHLAASLCVHYEYIKDQDHKLQNISNRPDAAILAYPVITTGKYTHRGSIVALLGENATAEELDYMSLEKHVTQTTPPCFLWHTRTDTVVPPQNSMAFVYALQEHHVNYAYHLFSDGPHGLSLADETWASEEYGTPYTMEQADILASKYMRGEIELSESAKHHLRIREQRIASTKVTLSPNTEVSGWPEMADTWLKKVLS